MVDLGIRADSFTYPSVLKACGDELDLGFGREVHGVIEVSGIGWCLFVENALVGMYTKCGDVEVARRLFDRMHERDLVSWNSMISGYASKGMWDEAFELFDRMRIKGVEMNVVTWNTTAGGFVQIGNYKGALELISEMKNCGSHLDHVAIVIGLSACSRLGLVKFGKEIHGVALRSLYNNIETVKNALITMYSKGKDLRHAYILFQSLKVKSVITWNSMIAGYTRLDQYEEASFVFREMVACGVEPNYVTIASILPLCARVANLQHGKELHCYITRREKFKDFLLLLNSLVDMYSKSGKIAEARRVFGSMRQKDEVTYTCLIAGYGMQGEAQVALDLFEEMNVKGIKPDHITMVAVLSTCSHSGLVSQGEALFGKMINYYDIKPRMEHFACMVDLFGRAGFLERAVDLIRTMPFRPSPAMWATLIGSCRIHGNTNIGEWAAEKLVEMRPENPGYYVLIANMYAAAGRWSKLAYVRTLMRNSGVKKDPGCAWIDLGNGFHPFVVGDRLKPEAQEIYMLLCGLDSFMKESGYVESEDLGLTKDFDQ
ncbi:hypothetical protein GIB67_014398 [Kingdonia uniflora]|uniref:Pentatricopeptide repeat-containing protein n=1 Tax=Kingdonia uniflora TaxID=39325 RepID=A0A7J7LZ70_9MAGN|nr:hypothetical protein GIB67_014398 [Kingdonia uniflora]